MTPKEHNNLMAEKAQEILTANDVFISLIIGVKKDNTLDFVGYPGMKKETVEYLLREMLARMEFWEAPQ